MKIAKLSPEQLSEEKRRELKKEVDAMKGMKKKEIEKCLLCGQGVGHNGDPDFWRVSLERFFVDLKAVQQTAGMEMMMGGGPEGAFLTSIMGSDPDIAKEPSPHPSFILCSPCAFEPTRIVRLSESVTERENERDRDHQSGG